MLAEIDELVQQSSEPLDDEWLESLNEGDADLTHCRRFLYLLVKRLRPKVALELGVYEGRTLAHLCAAASEYGGHVIGVDLALTERVEELCEKYGGYLYFREGDTTSIKTVAWVEKLVEWYGPIGLVYQDSSHHFWASWMEWDHYLPCLDDFAVWLCDDVTDSFHSAKMDPPERGMVQYFNELPGEKKLYPDILHRGNTQGIALITSTDRDSWDGWYMRRHKRALEGIVD